MVKEHGSAEVEHTFFVRAHARLRSCVCVKGNEKNQNKAKKQSEQHCWSKSHVFIALSKNCDGTKRAATAEATTV